MTILLAALLATGAWAQNPPYTITETKDSRDAAALNQNLRALADSLRKSNATIRTLKTSVDSPSTATYVTTADTQTITGAKTFAAVSTFSATAAFTSTATFTMTQSSIPAANAIYADNVLKGWVNFSGTGCTGGASGADCTINGGFNVTRVQRTAIGAYDVYWYRTFANTNYAPAFVCSRSGASIMPCYRSSTPLSTTKAAINCCNYDGTAIDSDGPVTLMVVGSQ